MGGTVRAAAAMIARFSFVAAASAGMLGPAQAAHPDGRPRIGLGVGSNNKGDER